MARRSRRSIRLPEYDYANDGAYFVTTCVQDQACLFGDIVNDAMQLNECGTMVDHWWREIARKFPSVALDSYIIMPNHIHGILVFAGINLRITSHDDNNVGADLRVRPRKNEKDQGRHIGLPLQNPTLGQVIQWFKTMTTNTYIRGVKSGDWHEFHVRLWQRNYYEHVIRAEENANDIRLYIDANPARWADDAENPAQQARR